MKKNKEVIRIGFGSSLLLLVFIVISFISFAVLSLSSAITDRNLTQKIYDKNIAYYEACNLAQEQLAQIDTLLQNAYRESISEEKYFEVVSQNSKFTIPVSEYQDLFVEVTHQYPKKDGDCFYKITAFHLVNIYTPEAEQFLPVMQ